MKRILVTGTKSYIGVNTANWLSQFQNEYKIDFISVRDDAWKELDFTVYNVVFHVAAAVHTQEKEKNKPIFFEVNRDLTIAIAKQAKEAGVEQFIFMSTMAVYGEVGAIDKEIIITEKTEPKPKTYYGKSKLEAEKQLGLIREDNFRVAILRPPMIYGKDCPGNYQRLKHLSEYLWIFPMIENKRSVLHINNLCRFLKEVIDEQMDGLFIPQDKEYLVTSLLVKELANQRGRTIYLSRILGDLIKLFGRRIGIIRKMFGNLVYEK